MKEKPQVVAQSAPPQPMNSSNDMRVAPIAAPTAPPVDQRVVQDLMSKIKALEQVRLYLVDTALILSTLQLRLN